MATSTLADHAIDVEDVEYLRHGDAPLLARLFRPKGPGPFPLLVDLHGGAWCNGDRMGDTPINEGLAKAGIAVAALDFASRGGVLSGSLADIHYAIRWFKSRAARFKLRPDRVGAIGISSGGHQAALLGMRPEDPRYAGIPLANTPDARLRCIVLCWPVIDPLARYHYAKARKASGQPYPDAIDRVLVAHDKFWVTEAAMDEGNPVGALERGEKAELPPVLYLQGSADQMHPRPDLDRFVAAYRKRGGSVDLSLYEGEVEGFLNRNLTSPNVPPAMARIVEFVHRHLS